MTTRGPHLNENGGALMLVVVLSALVVFVGYMIGTTKRQQMQTVLQMNAPVSAQIIKSKVLATLMSDRAMMNTLNCHDGSVTNCAHTNANIRDLSDPDLVTLYDDLENGQLVVESKYSKAGFTLNGEPCESFESSIGNDQCPFRYELTLINAPPTKNPLQFSIRAKLKFRPRSLMNLNTLNFDFDYSNITGNQEIKTLTETCKAFANGELIGARVETGQASCTTFIKTCQGGGIVMDTNGVPICNPVQIKTAASCDHFIGINPTTGESVCAPSP